MGLGSSQPIADQRVYAQNAAPTDTRDGVLWVDTSKNPRETFVYSTTTDSWEPVAITDHAQLENVPTSTQNHADSIGTQYQATIFNAYSASGGETTTKSASHPEWIHYYVTTVDVSLKFWDNDTYTGDGSVTLDWVEFTTPTGENRTTIGKTLNPGEGNTTSYTTTVNVNDKISGDATAQISAGGRGEVTVKVTPTLHYGAGPHNHSITP